MPQRGSRSRIELKPTQERVLAALAEDGSVGLTRGRYEDLAGVSRSQAAYDLAELVDAGILERVGGGRATTYRFVRRARSAGQRHWTNERIHTALVDFCTGRKTWPSAREFKADGRSDLYVAASRYGGIGYWATALGFEQPSRTTTTEPAVRSWRPRLGWAAGGAAVAAALFAAAGTALYLGRDAPTHHAAAPRSAASASSARQSAPVLSKPNVSSRTATKAKRPRQVRQHARASSPSTRSGGVQSSAHAELAAVRVSTPTNSAASSSRQAATQRTTGSGSAGPTPLPSPSGAGTPPAPLPPPQG